MNELLENKIQQIKAKFNIRLCRVCGFEKKILHGKVCTICKEDVRHIYPVVNADADFKQMPKNMLISFEKISYYSARVRLKPEDNDGYFWRGYYFELMKRFTHAIKDYSQAIRLLPGVYIYHFRRGCVYSHYNLYDLAIDDFSTVLRSLKCPLVYIKRGECYEKTERFDRAILDYTEALNINERYDDAYNTRANCYSLLRLPAKALSDYNMAIRLSPHEALYFYNRACLLRDMNRNKEAISDFSRAIEIKPDYADALSNRGICHARCGSYDLSIEDYTKAILLNDLPIKQKSISYWNRAHSYFKKGEFENAIADFTAVIRYDPKNGGAYYCRGNAYKLLKRRAEAKWDYLKAARLGFKEKKF